MSSPSEQSDDRRKRREQSRRERRSANRNARDQAAADADRRKTIRNKRVLGKILESEDGRAFLFDTLENWGYFRPAPQTDPVLLARVTARRDCAAEFVNVAVLQFPGFWTKMIQENNDPEDLEGDYQEQRSKANVQ